MAVLRTKGLNPGLQVFLDSWPDRTRRFRKQLLFLVTQTILDQLLDKIPVTDALKSYRDSLDIGLVQGLGPDEVAYTVFINAAKARVRTVDSSKTLLYVRPRKSPRRTPDSVLVLVKHNPWTTVTLPFTPSRRVATIVSQKSTKNRVLKVTEARQHEKAVWLDELEKAGIHGARNPQIEVPRALRAFPETALTALSLELGFGEERKPHWKPVVSRMFRGPAELKKLFKKERTLMRGLWDPRFTGWRFWPKKIRGKLRVGDARKFVDFQKRLGIRF